MNWYFKKTLKNGLPNPNYKSFLLLDEAINFSETSQPSDIIWENL
jgi:hypothetical protein